MKPFMSLRWKYWGVSIGTVLAATSSRMPMYSSRSEDHNPPRWRLYRGKENRLEAVTTRYMHCTTGASSLYITYSIIIGFYYGEIIVEHIEILCILLQLALIVAENYMYRPEYWYFLRNIWTFLSNILKCILTLISTHIFSSYRIYFHILMFIVLFAANAKFLELAINSRACLSA